jgi:hypothetical protein
MAHDVFISHSSRDKPVSDAVCAALENVGIRCWVAPRDVQPGRSFAGEITRAIQQSKAMVLIFSANSNTSSQVLREVQLAVEAQLHILQFRIEDVLLNDDLKYFLSTPHWLDAVSRPLEQHLARLSSSLRTLLAKSEPETAGPVAVPAPQKSPSPPMSLVKPLRKNWLLALLVGLGVLTAIAATIVVLRRSELPKNEPIATTSPTTVGAEPQKSEAVAPATSPAVTTEPETPAASNAPSDVNPETHPTPSAKGARLFSDDFKGAAPTMKPVAGSDVMSVANTNGVGQITGKAAGIIPAIFDKVMVDDFIAECSMRADDVPAGARFGFIFRATDAVNGEIVKYYALLLDPNDHVVHMLWWAARQMTDEEQTLPAGLLRVGQQSRVTLEAQGNRFRVFINGRFAAEFASEGLNEGRFGLCLFGVDTQPWTVSFNDLQVFLPPGKSP